MTFKKMNPEDFKVGRKYRTNESKFKDYIYLCKHNVPNKPYALVRNNNNYVCSNNHWEWEEIVEKKRVFK